MDAPAHGALISFPSSQSRWTNKEEEIKRQKQKKEQQKKQASGKGKVAEKAKEATKQKPKKPSGTGGGGGGGGGREKGTSSRAPPVFVIEQSIPPPMSKTAKAKLKQAINAAATAAEAARVVAAEAEEAVAAARLPNTVGGVVIGRPQPAPAEDRGEVVVLSHVLSPAVAKEWKRLHFAWKQRHNLLDATLVKNLTLREAVAATVVETCLVASHNRVLVVKGGGSKGDDGDEKEVGLSPPQSIRVFALELRVCGSNPKL